MNEELTNRRGLMRSIATQVARGARDAATAHSEMREQLASLGAEGPPADEVPPGRAARTFLPAQPTTRCLRCEELLELADDFGLANRRDAIRERCRFSARLVPSAPSERPETALPPVPSWPSWRGGPLLLLLWLDLAEVAAACRGVALPATGTLSVFFFTGESPSGLALDHGGACQVLFSPESLLAGPERSEARAVEASGELTLPRVWAESVDALGLSSEEQAAWEQLRLHLAELQGVEPFDAQSRSRAIHRALGWPDERGGWMPLACALIDEGIDLAGEAPAMHPRARELADRAGEWRLLLQLTAEPRLDWVWGGKDRLYVWIKARDLALGEFGRVRAFVL